MDRFQNILAKLFGGIMPRAKSKTTKKSIKKEIVVKEQEVGRLVIDTLSVMTTGLKQSLVEKGDFEREDLKKIFAALESHEVSTRNKALDQVSSLFKANECY